MSHLMCHMSHMTGPMTSLLQNFQSQDLATFRHHHLCVTWHMIHIMCQLSNVTCHLKHVTCHMLMFFLGGGGQGRHWCIQWVEGLSSTGHTPSSRRRPRQGLIYKHCGYFVIRKLPLTYQPNQKLCPGQSKVCFHGLLDRGVWVSLIK